jgi:hypothetical protein
MSKVYRLEKPAATLGEERLTPKRTASCPHAAFQLHSKPQPGSDAVARVVYARHGRECGGASPL